MKDKVKGSMVKFQKIICLLACVSEFSNTAFIFRLRALLSFPLNLTLLCVVRNEKYNFVLNGVGVLFVTNQF